MGITTYTNCLRIERTDGVVLCLTELDKDLYIQDRDMGIASTTILDTSELVSSGTIDHISSSTTFKDDNLIASEYINYLVKFTSGTNIDKVYLIENSNVTNYFIISSTTGLIVGDTFEIYSDYVQYLTAAGYTPTNLQSTSDNSVNNADVEGVLSSVGVKREDIIGGRYDFARLHMFIWDYVNNTLIKKLGTGNWGECTIKDGSYTAEYRSLSQQLQQNIGRTYNPECDEQLGGTRCTVDLAPYTTNGSVITKTDNSNITLSETYADFVLNYGKLTFTSGLNTGLYMEVKNNVGSDIELYLPMPFDIEVGDTYTVYQGCNKILDTCKDKFSNNINFQGFPYIPGQDAITRFGGQ